MTTKKIAYIALFAAVNFVAFTFIKIDFVLPGGSPIAISAANGIVVLSAFLLGPIEGALAGAIGLSLADVFDPKYIQFAPMTFMLKFLIGIIAGAMARKLKLSQMTKKRDIVRVSTICASVALGINVLAYPLVKYVYFNYLLRIGSEASAIMLAWTNVVTIINAIICVILSVALYGALKKSFVSIYRG